MKKYPVVLRELVEYNLVIIRIHFLIFVQAEAEGDLYVDDGYTFDYKNGAYIYMKFTFQGGRLVAK